jgi:hypothetical protein
MRSYWPPSAKLDADAVRAIRARYPTEGMMKLGEEFGVTPQNIRHIVINTSFYDADYTPVKLGPRGRPKANGHKTNGHSNGVVHGEFKRRF